MPILRVQRAFSIPLVSLVLAAPVAEAPVQSSRSLLRKTLQKIARLHGPALVLIATWLSPGSARAGNWGEDWGTVIWGGVAAVPSFDGGGLMMLGLALLATAVFVLRSRRFASVRSSRVARCTAAALLLVPMVAYAGPLLVPNTFTDGTVADADEVNANFSAVETEVNDNDARIDTNAGDIGTSTTAISTNATGISTNAGDILTNSSTIGTNTTAIGTNATDISTNATSITGNTASIGTNATNLSNHTGDTGNPHMVTLSQIGFQGRFEDCGDGTVADHQTGLQWEQKTGTVGSSVTCETAGCPDPHDVNNLYEWSNTVAVPDGGAYTDFLARLNGDPTVVAATSGQALGDPALDPTVCLAHHCDWRVSAIGELRTILIGPHAAPGQATTCSAAPCIDPDFAAIGGPTASSNYWSGSTGAGNPNNAWNAAFGTGFVFTVVKTTDFNVRAVRAGSCD